MELGVSTEPDYWTETGWKTADRTVAEDVTVNRQVKDQKQVTDLVVAMATEVDAAMKTEEGKVNETR